MIIENYLTVNGKNDLIYNIMKNIKTFEGFFDFLKKKPDKKITDKLYEPMEPGSEVESFFDNHSLETETKKEKDILKEYRKYKNITIKKFTDEYFTVVIFINQYKPLCFKCDTIDGVVQCLDDNKSSLFKYPLI